MNFDLEILRATVTDRRVLMVICLLEKQPWLRISELAAVVSLSASRLSYLFKKETGICIKQCSMELRLQRAAWLLVTTFLSIKEIRNAVGMPDGPHFDHRFKDRFQMTPSNYRNVYGLQFFQQTVDSPNTLSLKSTIPVTFTVPEKKETTLN